MATRKAILNNYNWSGGINAKVSPLFLKDSECEIIQNYHLDKVGALTKRYGTVNLGRQIVDNKNILNIYFFKDSQGTDYSNILVASNISAGTSSSIYATPGTTWGVSKTLDTADVIPYFTTFVDYIFRVNGSQVMASSADPTPTTGSWGTTNCLGTYIFKYICVWEDRVYVANDNSTNKKPSRIAWSSLPVSGNPLTITWAYDGTTASGKDAADINPDDNDVITWIEPFGSRMLVFKNHGLYRWTFGQVEPDKIIDEGTPQGLTVKQIHSICFFANQKGVWAYGGGQPKLISAKVQPFIDAVGTDYANWTRLRAEVDNDHYYLYIGDVTVNGKAYANTMLVYTISLNAWHIYTFPWEIKAMAKANNNVQGYYEDVIYLGNDDGYVYQFNASGVPSSTISSDRILYNTTEPIDGYILTKEYPLNFPKTTNLNQMYVVAQPGQGIKVNYRLDRTDFVAWRDLKERITEGRLGGRTRTIQLSLTDNSENSPSVIEGFSVEHTIETEDRIKS